MSRGGGASAVELSEELAGRLRALGRSVSPEEIGDLWIFPPLSDVEESAEFFLFTRLLERDRRRVYSARLPPGAADGNGAGAAGNGRGGTGGEGAGGNGGPGSRSHAPGQEITEHGSVPAGRMPRLVERFRRRLEDDGEPVHVIIDGRRERWVRLVAED